MKKKKTLGFKWVTVGALIVSVVLNIFLLVKGRTENNEGVKVIAVIDGDTLLLEGQSRVRLLFANAPPIENCGGRQAKEFVTKLVLGKKVKLANEKPDFYGRNLAVVYVNNIMVNRELIKSGWARFHTETVEGADALKTVAAYAKEQKVGIFGKCESKDIPDKKGCTIKGNIADRTGIRNYYVPECGHYPQIIVEKDKGEAWFCSEKEAVYAGYAKTKTC